jgi:Rrf2 family iron-sulfur cluster assembly transcriptional regulator
MMKLSTKGRHAVTAMMELALRHDQGPVTLADISAQQSISISYLEQLFARLRQQKLVTGMRGPGGGYCLARQAGEITIADILGAVDDMARRDESSLSTGEIRGSMVMWQRLSNRVYDYLDSITLADAVEREEDDAQESLFGPGFQKTAA